MQFIIRARSEGTAEMREALQNDVSHLARFAEALKTARPDLPPESGPSSPGSGPGSYSPS